MVRKSRSRKSRRRVSRRRVSRRRVSRRRVSRRRVSRRRVSRRRVSRRRVSRRRVSRRRVSRRNRRVNNLKYRSGETIAQRQDAKNKRQLEHLSLVSRGEHRRFYDNPRIDGYSPEQMWEKEEDYTPARGGKRNRRRSR